jgi:hypothetical protein
MFPSRSKQKLTISNNDVFGNSIEKQFTDSSVLMKELLLMFLAHSLATLFFQDPRDLSSI